MQKRKGCIAFAESRITAVQAKNVQGAVYLLLTFSLPVAYHCLSLRLLLAYLFLTSSLPIPYQILTSAIPNPYLFLTKRVNKRYEMSKRRVGEYSADTITAAMHPGWPILRSAPHP